MDEPKTLSFEQIREERLSGLLASHIAPMTRFVEELRQMMRANFVDLFDKNDLVHDLLVPCVMSRRAACHASTPPEDGVGRPSRLTWSWTTL